MDLIESLIPHGLEFDLLGEKGMVNMGPKQYSSCVIFAAFIFSERTN